MVDGENPAEVRVFLALLRAHLGWSQADLATASGISKSSICRYESSGRIPPEAFGKIHSAVGLSVPVARRLFALIRAARAFLAGALPSEGLSGAAMEATGKIADGVADLLRASLPAIIEGLPGLTEGPWGQIRPVRADNRLEAITLLERLKRRTAGQRRVLVEDGREYRNWGLCELLCAESVQAAADNADQAVELAELALLIAELAPGEQGWRWRLQGYAWAHVGNARRVKGDLPGAEQAFLESDRLWRAGAPGDPGLLNGIRLLDLRASLLRYQGRFAEALSVLDQALSEGAGEATGRLLINKANTLELMGDYQAAIQVLRQVAPLLDEKREPRLAWLQRCALATNLCHVGRPEEAEEILPDVRVLAAQLGNGLDSLRLRWLEGRVAAGVGRRQEAVEALSQVRAEFADRGIAYDTALATLELAVLYLEEGRTGEVRTLARQMAPIFKAQGVHLGAVAALKVFCEAAEKEAATVALGRRVVEFLYRARNNPQLRFEPRRREEQS